MRDLKVQLDKIDKVFKRFAILLVVLYGGVFVICRFALALDAISSATLATGFFQMGLIYYGMGFVARHFVRGDIKSNVSIEMGAKTSEYIEKLHKELAPTLKKLMEEKQIGTPIGSKEQAVKEVGEKADL